MRFLIAGLGSAGRRHLRNLQALGERDIVLLRTGRATLPDNDLPDLPIESELAAALARRPDAVIVSNPTALHLDVAVPSARAGCHLLIEKPVSHDLSRIDELSDAVHEGGGQVLVGYQYRYHPLLQRMRALVHEGRLGRLRWALAHWGEFLPEWHPWEDYRQGYASRRNLGGGVLLTLSHPLDYLPWICGPLSCTSARIRTLGGLGIEVDDYVDLWLEGAGLTATVHLDYYETPMQHWLALGGDRGGLRLDLAVGRLNGWLGEELVEVEVPGTFDRNDMFLAEMRHFLRVCDGAETPACGLDEGLASLRLAIAARRFTEDGVANHMSRTHTGTGGGAS